ncbi:MAG: DHHA1 domain-containing protein, partial [Planctomycetota bacterium]|nr:DHHA1 domain-containing protein [Planctomycetota bacterium]
VGAFRILAVLALAAGVRRMEAVAADAALASFRQDRERLIALETELKTPADRLLERVQALKEQLKEARSRKTAAVPDAASVAEELSGMDGLAWKHFDGLDAEALCAVADGLKGKPLPGIVLLTAGDVDTVPFVFLCAPGAGARAGDLAKAFGKKVGGGGGGRPDFAQGKGSQGGELENAVEAFRVELAASRA